MDGQMEERISFYVIDWLDEKKQEADEPSMETDRYSNMCIYMHPTIGLYLTNLQMNAFVNFS